MSSGRGAKRSALPRVHTARRAGGNVWADVQHRRRLTAAQGCELGGMQAPCVVEMVANVFFGKAGVVASARGAAARDAGRVVLTHWRT